MNVHTEKIKKLVRGIYLLYESRFRSYIESYILPMILNKNSVDLQHLNNSSPEGLDFKSSFLLLIINTSSTKSTKNNYTGNMWELRISKNCLNIGKYLKENSKVRPLT